MKQKESINIGILLLSIIIVLSFIFYGCSSKGDSKKASSMDTSGGSMEELENNNSISPDNQDLALEEKTNITTDMSNRKLIKNLSMNLETKEFDSLINNLVKETEKSGGYIERSEIRGNSYNSHENRYATYVVRIPVDKLETFKGIIKNNGNILSSSEEIEDITSTYIDTESRITALRTEQESLLKLLEKAESLKDVFEIQSRLTEVRYELESFERQLRSYDNLVAYSTINIYIQEVDRETKSEDTNLWSEIKFNLNNNLYNIKSWFRSFVIGFVGGLPYLIIWGIIISIAVIAFRKIYKRLKNKNHL